MSLNGNINVSVELIDRTTASTTGVNTHAINEKLLWSIANGSGANQAEVVWSADFTLAATSTTHNLLALTGPKGTTTFAKVKGYVLYNAETTDGRKLAVGNAGSDIWTPYQSSSTNIFYVPPSGIVLAVNPLVQTTDPWTVDSTHKNWKFDSGANSVTGYVIIWGV